MKSNHMFIISGILILLVATSLLFVPTDKTDVIVTVTINNQLFSQPSITTTSAELVPHTILNFKTASIFDVFESGELTLEVIADRKISKKDIGTMTETDEGVFTMRVSDVNPQLTKLTVNLYENNIIRDTKEVIL